MTEYSPVGVLRDPVHRRPLNGDIGGHVRTEVAVSWRRSVLHGVRRDHIDPRYDPDLDFGGRFAMAAGPVAEQLGEELAGTGVALLLSDERAGLLDRRVSDPSLVARLDQFLLAPGFRHGEEYVGTNALGTALHEAGPVAVSGSEHFAEVFQAFACSAAPVADPRTGITVGAIGLTCAAETANSLMLPLVKRAMREIERRLLDDTSANDGALLAYFLQARRRAKGPLVAVSETTMHTNASAAGLLQPGDQALLWDWAARALAGDGPADDELRLTGGLPVGARARAVHDGGTVVGALVRFDPPADARQLAEPDGPVPSRPAFGWDSLTDTERGVAGIIAEGATNRAAAARLYLSRHTIDYHLRQIFRKLGIASRVELTRLVIEQIETDPAPQPQP
jgi:DNA-binding CsgD family transcriptional regulator